MYTLDTWRRIFRSPLHQITIVKEIWRDWPNPELNENIDIIGNDKVWKEWSKKCGSRMKEKGVEFYEDQDIDSWWSHLHTGNRREVLKWVIYDRLDHSLHRWHGEHSTGVWNYYLGKIPGLRNQGPRAIFHSRERPVHYCESQATPTRQNELQRYPTQDECKYTEEMIIPK